MACPGSDHDRISPGFTRLAALARDRRSDGTGSLRSPMLSEPQSMTPSSGSSARKQPGRSLVGPRSCPKKRLTPASFHLTPEAVHVTPGERLGVRRMPFGVRWGQTVLMSSDPSFPLTATSFTSLGSVGSDDSLLKTHLKNTGLEGLCAIGPEYFEASDPSLARR
jgi:hypothetical protein